MIGLAIHTSSPELGLALTDLADEERSQVWPLGRDLTAYLHPCLQEFITPYRWEDLAFLAVARGPGGFTGTRIGVVVARTLAQQLGVPLFGVSCLAAIAQHHYQNLTDGPQLALPVAVTLPAQRGEVFGALYHRSAAQLVPLVEEALYAEADWAAQLKSYPTLYPIRAEGGWAASVTGVLFLATQCWQLGDRPEWHTVLPFYGQHPVPQ